MLILPRRIPISTSHRMVFCVVLLVTPIALGSLAFVRGKADRDVVARIKADQTAPAVMPLQGNSPMTRLDAEHITLRATGFEPSEITRPAGPFLLAVDNVTGMGEMSFRLLNQDGARVRDFPAKGRYRLRQFLDLPPGRYALVVINHRDWVCRVTMTAP